MSIIAGSTNDLFEIDLTELRDGSIVPFALFVHLRLNNHLVVLKEADEDLTADEKAAYLKRGLRKVLVRKADREKYDSYKSPKKLIVEPTITEAVISRSLPEETKIEVARTAAQALIAETSAQPTRYDQKPYHDRNRAVVQDLLAKTDTPAKTVLDELWAIVDIDPDLEQAVMVATYSVLFVLAFGQIDPEVIADVALAAMLHDLGMLKVPNRAAREPWKHLEGENRKHFESHVSTGLGLLTTLLPNVPERVRVLVAQHHEKFDGSGFPEHLEGFDFDDLAQLLSLADWLEAFSSGRYDGTNRTLRNAFVDLRTVEKSRTFPENFNPEIFKRVLEWVETEDAVRARERATQTAREDRDQIKKKAS